MSNAPLVCQICKESKSPHRGMIAELIRPSLLEFIKKKSPTWITKRSACIRSLSIHSAQSNSLLSRRGPGAGHHDEPKPRRGARSFARGKRLQHELESGARDSAFARETRSSLAPSIYRLFEIQQIHIELLQENRAPQTVTVSFGNQGLINKGMQLCLGMKQFILFCRSSSTRA
jgi:hypothetical protein